MSGNSHAFNSYSFGRQLPQIESFEFQSTVNKESIQQFWSLTIKSQLQNSTNICHVFQIPNLALVCQADWIPSTGWVWCKESEMWLIRVFIIYRPLFSQHMGRSLLGWAALWLQERLGLSHRHQNSAMNAFQVFTQHLSSVSSEELVTQVILTIKQLDVLWQYSINMQNGIRD